MALLSGHQKLSLYLVLMLKRIQAKFIRLSSKNQMDFIQQVPMSFYTHCSGKALPLRVPICGLQVRGEILRFSCLGTQCCDIQHTLPTVMAIYNKHALDLELDIANKSENYKEKLKTILYV